MSQEERVESRGKPGGQKTAPHPAQEPGRMEEEDRRHLPWGGVGELRESQRDRSTHWTNPFPLCLTQCGLQADFQKGVLVSLHQARGDDSASRKHSAQELGQDTAQ